MDKTTIFVVVYSVFLLGMFSTMCYLMTTVAPEPIIQNKHGDSEGKSGGQAGDAGKNKTDARRKFEIRSAGDTGGKKGDERKKSDASDRRGGEGAGGDVGRSESAEGGRKAQRGSPNYRLSEHHEEENSDEETLQQFIREYSVAQSRNQGKKFVTIVQHKNRKSTEELTSPATTSPKMDIPVLYNPSTREYNRRSINAVKQENNTDLVFKIVDEDGYPRVEIKVNNKMKKIRKRKHLRLKATHKNVENKNKQLSEHSKVVILKMFPNDTLSFEEKNEISNDTNDTAEVKETTDNEEKIKDNFVSYNETKKYKSPKSVNFIAGDNLTKTNLNDTIISGLLDGKKYSQNEIRNISSVLDDSVAVITEVLKDDVKNAA